MDDRPLVKRPTNGTRAADDINFELCIPRRALFAGLGLLAGSMIAGIPVPALAVGAPGTITIGSVTRYPDYVGMRDWIGYWAYSHQMRSNSGEVMYCCDPTLGTPWAGQVLRNPYSGGKVLDYLVYYGYGGPGNNGSLYGQTDPNVMEAITQMAIWHCLGKISSTGVTHTRKWNQAGVDTWHWAENGVAADPNGPYVGCAHIYDPDPGTGTQRVIGLSAYGDVVVTKTSSNQGISNSLGASFNGLKYNLYDGGSWADSEAPSHLIRQVTLNSSGKGTFQGVPAGTYRLREDPNMGSSGYSWNSGWVSVTVRAGQTTYCNVSDDPIVHVRFWVVDLAGNATQVYSCGATYGSTFTSSSSEVANANNAAKSRYPSDYNLLRKWYTDKNTTAGFSSIKLTTAYTDLYARLPVTVSFVIIDGTGTSYTVHSQKVSYRTYLSKSHGMFGTADGNVSSRWPSIPIGNVTRWYLDTGITNPFTDRTLTGNITLYGRLPATVHFIYVKADGSTSEVHNYTVISGTTVRSSDQGFKDADSKLKETLGVESLDYVARWYTSKAGTSKFSSQRVLQNLYVYARPQYGSVVYYVDGTSSSNIVVLPDGSRAIYNNIPLGTRITVRDEVTQAARRPNCTPGLTAWYTDPSDPAISSDSLPDGVAAAGATRAGLLARAGTLFRRAATTRAAAGYSKFTSAVLTQPIVRLYGVNRATITFELTDDSVVPREDVTYRTGPSESMPIADTSTPGPKVVRVDCATALPSRESAFEPQEGGRWRTLSPYFWYDSPAGDGSAFTMTSVSQDTTLYLRWEYRTTDGIVDRRG